MIVEISGTQYVNKGAELMLRCIIEKLRQKLPEVKIVAAPNLLFTPYIKRAEMGLYQKIWLQKFQVQWGYFGAFLPEKLRRMYGTILDSEIDLVLDASGFCYSDQFGPRNCVMTAKAIKKWKRQGTRVIFMPQAFGPFTGSKICKAVKTIVKHADLIFARDRVSYKHITDITGAQENVKIAPDFTNLIKGVIPSNFDKNANKFCIIPNYRMIEKTSAQESRKYLSFLVNAISYLYDKGAKPFILIHEGENDIRLGKEIVKKSALSINIVHNCNSLDIKGIIGASDGVISSRYHGLVSALSQGVPALATGWSHKYETLFDDYGFPDGMVSLNADPKEIQYKIDMLISDTSKHHIMEKIQKASFNQKIDSSIMWDEVFAIITK